MKKLSILIVGLLLVSGMAFAADIDVEAPPTVDLDFDAGVTWGVDLNENTTGFYNDASISITIEWTDEEDFEATGDDGVYGYIMVDDLTLNAATFTYDDITAKLVISPLEVTIWHESAAGSVGGPSFSIDNASTPGSEDIIFTDDLGDAVAGNEANAATTLTALNGGIYGITISVPVDIVTVDVLFASDGDWTAQTTDDSVYGDYSGDGAATSNVDNQYAAGVDLSVDLAPITLGVNFQYGWFADQTDLGLGAEVDVELADILYGLDLAFDFDATQNVTAETDLALDFGVGATLAIAEENEDGDSSEFGIEAYIAPYNDGDIDMDVVISLTEEEDGGLVDMLYANVGVELHDLLGPDGNDLNWAFLVDGGYDTGDVDPYFEFAITSNSVVGLGLGVVLKEGITGLDNTTVTLDYQADDLTDESALITNDSGIVTVAVNVSF